MTQATPSALARDAAARLAELTGVQKHDVALVLGSGWLPAVDALGEVTAEIATTDLPGFGEAAVVGHAGRIRSVRAGDTQALVFLSRTHLYEGKGVAAVVHGVRTAAAAGCRAIVLTNGCGGLKETWSPGTPVLISDHINLTGRSPLTAPTSSTSPTSTPAPAGPVPRGRRDPRRGRLRAVPRPPLRDPRRDRHGARDRRPPGRHEHHPRGDRRARGGPRGARPQPGHQPRRRHQRRAARPRGGPRGRPGRRRRGWATCSPAWSR